MSRIASLWLLSLALVALVASAVTAQVVRSTPQIVTGDNLGFRVEGTDMKGRPVGSIVIRVDGEWVATGEPMRATRAVSDLPK